MKLIPDIDTFIANNSLGALVADINFREQVVTLKPDKSLSDLSAEQKAALESALGWPIKESSQ